MQDIQKQTKILDKIQSLNCKIHLNEPMKKHCSFKIGGTAGLFIDIGDLKSLCQILEIVNKENLNYRIIGNGSNILFPDEDINFIILHLSGNFNHIKISPKNSCSIICGAGTNLAKLCKFALDHSLSGLEFAWGIPGTVGGAIYMNAGAFSGEISQVLESCSFVDNSLSVHSLKNKNLDFSYRHSRFENSTDIIVQAKFTLKVSDKDIIKSKMNNYLSQRKSKQPLNFPNAGSIFKRPSENYSAGELIDMCKLKGTAIGGAMISPKHANFIVNTGNASSTDVKKLIEYTQNKVKNLKNINLQCEIQQWPNF